ncbi:hypothetical protein EV401DRAFT_2196183 [Pisolithus croceorrhizus]|nr:hypothetical protein EV401DRAFT_2196183 [Pisolithus croceorrhizus]
MTLFHSTNDREQPRRQGFNMFSRKDGDRVSGGNRRTARSNPKTTRSGRKRTTQNERRIKGRERDTHVPLMAKVKQALGIQNTPPRRSSVTRTFPKVVGEASYIILPPKWHFSQPTGWVIADTLGPLITVAVPGHERGVHE